MILLFIILLAIIAVCVYYMITDPGYNGDEDLEENLPPSALDDKSTV